MDKDKPVVIQAKTTAKLRDEFRVKAIALHLNASSVIRRLIEMWIAGKIDINDKSE
jgi:hypothetical protein